MQKTIRKKFLKKYCFLEITLLAYFFSKKKIEFSQKSLYDEKFNKKSSSLWLAEQKNNIFSNFSLLQQPKTKNLDASYGSEAKVARFPLDHLVPQNFFLHHFFHSKNILKYNGCFDDCFCFDSHQNKPSVAPLASFASGAKLASGTQGRRVYQNKHQNRLVQTGFSNHPIQKHFMKNLTNIFFIKNFFPQKKKFMQYWIFPLVGFVAYTWNPQTNFPQLHHICAVPAMPGMADLEYTTSLKLHKTDKNKGLLTSTQTYTKHTKQTQISKLVCKKFFEIEKQMSSNENFYFFKKLEAKKYIALNFYSVPLNSLQTLNIQNLNKTYLNILQKKIFSNTNFPNLYNYSNNIFWFTYLNSIENFHLKLFKNKFQTFLSKSVFFDVPFGPFPFVCTECTKRQANKPSCFYIRKNTSNNFLFFSHEKNKALINQITKGNHNMFKHGTQNLAKKILPVSLNQAINSDEFIINKRDPLYFYHKGKDLLENHFKFNNLYVYPDFSFSGTQSISNKTDVVQNKYRADTSLDLSKINFSFLKKQQNFFDKNKNKSKFFQIFEKILQTQICFDNSFKANVCFDDCFDINQNKHQNRNQIYSTNQRKNLFQMSSSVWVTTKTDIDVLQQSMANLKTLNRQLNIDLNFIILLKQQSNFPIIYKNSLKEKLQIIDPEIWLASFAPCTSFAMPEAGRACFGALRALRAGGKARKARLRSIEGGLTLKTEGAGFAQSARQVCFDDFFVRRVNQNRNKHQNKLNLQFSRSMPYFFCKKKIEKKLLAYFIEIKNIQKKLFNLKQIQSQIKNIQYKLEFMNSMYNLNLSGPSLRNVGSAEISSQQTRVSKNRNTWSASLPVVCFDDYFNRPFGPFPCFAPQSKPCVPEARQVCFDDYQNRKKQTFVQTLQVLLSKDRLRRNFYADQTHRSFLFFSHEKNKAYKSKNPHFIVLKNISKKKQFSLYNFLSNKRLFRPIKNAGLYPSALRALRAGGKARNRRETDHSKDYKRSVLMTMKTNIVNTNNFKFKIDTQMYLQAKLNKSIRKKNSNNHSKIFASMPNNYQNKNPQHSIDFQKIQRNYLVFLKNLMNRFMFILMTEKFSFVFLNSTTDNQFVMNSSSKLNHRKEFSKKNFLHKKLDLEKKNLEFFLAYTSNLKSSDSIKLKKEKIFRTFLSSRYFANIKHTKNLSNIEQFKKYNKVIEPKDLRNKTKQSKDSKKTLKSHKNFKSKQRFLHKDQKKQILMKTLRKLKIRMYQRQTIFTTRQVCFEDCFVRRVRGNQNKHQNSNKRSIVTESKDPLHKLSLNKTIQKIGFIFLKKHSVLTPFASQGEAANQRACFDAPLAKGIKTEGANLPCVPEARHASSQTDPNVNNSQIQKNKVSANLIKQKYLQKKRRRKKLKLENRRRKKRKRFYPRPIWLRYSLYRTFLNNRYNKNYSIISNQKILRYKHSLLLRQNQLKRTNSRSNKKLKVLRHIHTGNQIKTNIIKLNKSMPSFFLTKKIDAGFYECKNRPNTYHSKKLLFLDTKQKLKILLQRNNKQKWGNFALDTNFIEKSSLKKYLLSTDLPIYINKNYYKISNLLQELTIDLYWKSYWLRTHLKPYMNRIEKNLNYQKLITQNLASNIEDSRSIDLQATIKMYFFFLSNLVGGFISNLQNFSFYSYNFPVSSYVYFDNSLRAGGEARETRFASGTKPAPEAKQGQGRQIFYLNKKNSFKNIGDFSFSNMHIIENMRLIKEHDRILFDRISEIIKNVKYNLTLDGEKSIISYKLPKSKYNLLNNSFKNTQTNSLLNSLKSSMFQQLDPNFSVFSAMNLVATSKSENSTVLKPYGSNATLRVLWAFNKTNLLSFKEKNSIKNLWETYKNAEQSKSNQTKKFLKKTFTHKIQTVLNSGLTLSSGQHILSFSKNPENSVLLSNPYNSSIDIKTDRKKKRDFKQKFKKNQTGLFFLKEKNRTNTYKMILLNSTTLKKFQNVQKKLFDSVDLANKKLFYQKNISPWSTYDKSRVRTPVYIEGYFDIPFGQNKHQNTWKQDYKSKKYKQTKSNILENTDYVQKPLLKKSSNFFWWSVKNFLPTGYFSQNLSDSHIVTTFHEIKNLRAKQALLQSKPTFCFDVHQNKRALCRQREAQGTKARKGTKLLTNNSRTSILVAIQFIAILFHLCIFMNLFKLPELRNLFKFQLCLIYKILNIYFITLNSFYTSVQKFQNQIKNSFLRLSFFHKNLNWSVLSEGYIKTNKYKNYKSSKTRNLFFSHEKNKTLNLFSTKPNLLSTVSAIQSRDQSTTSFTCLVCFDSHQNKPYASFAPLAKQASGTKTDYLRSNSIGSISKESNVGRPIDLEKLKPTFMVFNNQKNSFLNILGLFFESVFLLLPCTLPLAGKGRPRAVVKTNRLFFENKALMFIYTLTIYSRFFIDFGIGSIRSIYICILKIIEIIESLLLLIYKFLEKPAELMIESIAQIFLIEWISDICTFIPETLDQNIWESFQKFSRPINYSIISILGFSSGPLLAEQSKGTIHLLHFFIPISFILLQTIKQFYFGLWEFLLKPDMDLITRQKKGIYFMNIWGEIFIQAAEKYQMNVTSLVTNNSEQEKFMERLLKDPEIFSARNASVLMTEASLAMPEGGRACFGALRALPPARKARGLTLKTEGAKKQKQQLASQSQREAKPAQSLCFGDYQNREMHEFRGTPGLLTTKYIDFQFIADSANSKEIPFGCQRQEGYYSGLFFSYEKNRKTSEIANNSISINQHIISSCLGGQYSTYSDLFLDIAPPKSFHSMSYLQSPIYFIIGPILCEVYAGLFSKKVSKNILLVTKKTNFIIKDFKNEQPLASSRNLSPENSSDTYISNLGSFLIEALAGETEMKLIIDNAKRYSFHFSNKAIGIRLLKDVFMSIALQTPSFFLIEDIHFIAEKRPMLIGNFVDENVSSINLANMNLVPEAQDETHFQNQYIYQLSRHKILDYKRPYKGDSSLIPANFYSKNLFKQNSNHTNLSIQNQEPTKINFSNSFFMKKQKKHPLSFIPTTNLASNIELINQSSPSMRQKKKSSTTLQTRLQMTSEEFFAPPSTSPFTILLKSTTGVDQKKISRKSIEKKVSGFHSNKSQTSLKNQFNQDSSVSGAEEAASIRSKIAQLAHITLRHFSGSLDMITDLLVIVDSVRSNRGFVVFATTPIPSILDPALRRPGRFDETLCLPEFHLKYESQIVQRSDFCFFSLKKTGLFFSYEKNRNIGLSPVGGVNARILCFPDLRALPPARKVYQNKGKGRNFQTTNKNNLLKILLTCSKLITHYLTQVDLLKNQTNKFFRKLIHQFSNNSNHFTTFFILPTYSTSFQYKNYMLSFLAPKVGNFFYSSRLTDFSIYIDACFDLPFGQNSHQSTGSIDRNSTQKFIFSLVEKRYLFHKNFIVSKMLSLENLSNSLREPPGPPISEILMPAKKYEAFKTTEQEFILKNSFSIYEKMHSHQKQRFLKKLYNQPIQIYFKSLSRGSHENTDLPLAEQTVGFVLMPACFDSHQASGAKLASYAPLAKTEVHKNLQTMGSNMNDFTTFIHSFKELGSIGSIVKNSKTILLKGSSTNYYYKTRFLLKHRFSFTNQWWNAQLPEHNMETTFLSDVDWRSMYLQSNKKNREPSNLKSVDQKSQQVLTASRASPPAREAREVGISKTDQFIDFPDADQFYNPRIRKWIFHHTFSNKFNFENVFTYEIYYNFLMQSIYIVYNFFDKNRELLDYFIYIYLQKGSILELDSSFILSRFYKK